MLPRSVAAGGVAVLLSVSWIAVYAHGGTHTALPHLLYIPIVVAALPFGMSGGVVVAVIATFLVGPLMPLDVAAGEPQQLANWLIRGAFFVAVGTITGASTTSLRRSFQTDLTAHLWQELEAAAPVNNAPDDATWATRIRVTIDTAAYHPVFQPIHALADGRLIAVEALTRFHPEPVQPPDIWFDRATRVGLGPELELATMTAALDASVELPSDITVCVNVSPDLLVDRRLLELLDQHRGRRLRMEVTEHAVVDDYHQLAEGRDALRARGIELAVDDAGAGFASLRHIVRLAPDVIKLDRSLTQHVRDDPVRRSLADCLIQFAQRTGSRIVAEGIEHPADLATWRELGAHAAQGYLLGRPARLRTARLPKAGADGARFSLRGGRPGSAHRDAAS